MTGWSGAGSEAESSSDDNDTPSKRLNSQRKQSRSSHRHKERSLQTGAEPTGGLLHGTFTHGPDHSLTPLERAKHTAKQVAWSTGEAVQQLAGKQLLNRSLGVRAGSGEETNVELSGTRVGPPHESQHSVEGVQDSAQSEPTQSLTPTFLSSSPEGRVQTPTTTALIHKAAAVSFPEGYSPAEKAAYAAEMVADSTSVAVQKLSTSLAQTNNTFLHRGYSPGKA